MDLKGGCKMLKLSFLLEIYECFRQIYTFGQVDGFKYMYRHFEAVIGHLPVDI